MNGKGKLPSPLYPPLTFVFKLFSFTIFLDQKLCVKEKRNAGNVLILCVRGICRYAMRWAGVEEVGHIVSTGNGIAVYDWHCSNCSVKRQRQ